MYSFYAISEGHVAVEVMFHDGSKFKSPHQYIERGDDYLAIIHTAGVCFENLGILSGLLRRIDPGRYQDCLSAG